MNEDYKLLGLSGPDASQAELDQAVESNLRSLLRRGLNRETLLRALAFMAAWVRLTEAGALEKHLSAIISTLVQSQLAQAGAHPQKRKAFSPLQSSIKSAAKELAHIHASMLLTQTSIQARCNHLEKLIKTRNDLEAERIELLSLLQKNGTGSCSQGTARESIKKMKTAAHICDRIAKRVGLAVSELGVVSEGSVVPLDEFVAAHLRSVEMMDLLLEAPLGQLFHAPDMAMRPLILTVRRPSPVASAARKKTPHTWAVYDGIRLVAEGESDSYIEAGRATREAAEREAAKENPNGPLDHVALSSYRASIWGPRGGIKEYQQPVTTPSPTRRGNKP